MNKADTTIAVIAFLACVGTSYLVGRENGYTAGHAQGKIAGEAITNEALRVAGNKGYEIGDCARTIMTAPIIDKDGVRYAEWDAHRIHCSALIRKLK
jgi:hypothetical protein